MIRLRQPFAGADVRKGRYCAERHDAGSDFFTGEKNMRSILLVVAVGIIGCAGLVITQSKEAMSKEFSMTTQDEHGPSSLKQSAETTRKIVNQYFSLVSAGAAPDEIASLFSENIDWNIPGNTAMVPWIGRRKGRAGVADFIRDLRNQTLPIHFRVRTIIADGENAVALGELQTKVISTGKIIETEFAFDFAVREGLIVQFQAF